VKKRRYSKKKKKRVLQLGPNLDKEVIVGGKNGKKPLFTGTREYSPDGGGSLMKMIRMVGKNTGF